MRYLRALIIFFCGSVLALACSGIAAIVLHAATPTPAPAFIIAALILLAGIGTALAIAIRSLRPEKYDICPACAFDVRQVPPGADGSLRCPSCGQWLT